MKVIHMTTKNATVKKEVKSKKPKKARNPEIAKHVEPDKYFFLADGRPIKSLFELADSLEDMSDEVFIHHVNPDKNDFAKWVQDVFGDEDLAIKLGQSKSRPENQLIILKHLVRRLTP
jgi:hypothetical protein